MVKLQIKCNDNSYTEYGSEKCSSCGEGCYPKGAPTFGYVEALIPTVNNRAMLNVFKVLPSGELLHYGKKYTLQEILASANACWYKTTLSDVLCPEFTVCFKKPSEGRQSRFYIKTNRLGLTVEYKGYDLDTGELSVLSKYMDDYGYSESDIVNIISNHENHKIRSYARRRAR